MSVKYIGDHPDFKGSGHVKAEVEIEDMKGDHYHDYAAAEEALGGPKPENTTWHHKEDMKTMQAVDSDVHSTFTHMGGVSAKKKQD